MGAKLQYFLWSQIHKQHFMKFNRFPGKKMHKMSKITKEIINKRERKGKKGKPNLDLYYKAIYYKAHALLTRLDLGFSAVAQNKMMNSLI